MGKVDIEYSMLTKGMYSYILKTANKICADHYKFLDSHVKFDSLENLVEGAYLRWKKYGI